MFLVAWTTISEGILILIQTNLFFFKKTKVLNLRQSNLKNILFDYHLGASFIINNQQLSSVIHYNTLAFHSSANILNEVTNFILAVATNYNLSLKITTINVPLSANNTLDTDGKVNFLNVLGCLDTMPGTLLNFVNAVVTALIISFIVMHVARERTSGSKQLQLMSDVHYSTYWLANYLFDLIVVLINVTLLVIILKSK
jgi:hypothetical protein